MVVQPTTSLLLKWDPRNLEIRTKSVEKTLEPLVTQVTTLLNQNGPSKKKKGRSKKAHVLSAAVQKATEHFMQSGEEIANENPEIRNDLLAAIEEVKVTGEVMRVASIEFANDPCSSVKRGAMVRAARALLSAVTRLLILADMVDVHLLLKSLRIVEDDLDRIRNAQNQQDLMNSFGDFGRSLFELNDRAGRRQMDLIDERRRDDLAAARATLKKNSVMLLTTSKIFVRHPEIAAARANRDYVLREVANAVQAISGAAQATGVSQTHPYETAGELAAALDEFDVKIIMDPLSFSETCTRPSLEELLEGIISGAALMADSSCTRDERRERIVQECNAVRQALQDLLSEYLSSTQHVGNNASLDLAQDHVSKKTKELRKQLRKAVMDHISDSFLETNIPLLVLMEAAKAGNEREVEEYAQVFQEHVNKLIEVANLACSMSNNEEGVKMVRIAGYQLDSLCPQVINAARVLALRPRSKVALENMEVFKDAWERQVRLLTEAVDDITTVEDFLSVTEGHILEDVNKCIMALQERDRETLDRTAGVIRGRCARVCSVVNTEMFNYEPGPYTDRVMEAVVVLRDQVIINFAQKTKNIVDALGQCSHFSLDENGFVHISTLVYDSVREIRKAVLMQKISEENDSDLEVENELTEYETRSKSSYITDQDNVIYEEDNDRGRMRALPEEERIKIQQQVQVFRVEKAKLDRELAKWDESGNDIIILAKQMCMIMMEMTDFTRGRGPLKSTMDVINAAKKISEAGANLDKLCKQIADQCPDSASKKDLMAYLQRIALYCHQLNITSKVKADVQNISGELIVSGLDSATSLIQAAKNLMNAVVLAVKASYVASTKYPKAGTIPSVVTWKMRAPEKKPLVHREHPEESRSRVRKAEQKKNIEPIKELKDFVA